MTQDWIKEPLEEGCWNGCMNCAGAPRQLGLDKVLWGGGGVDSINVYSDNQLIWESELSNHEIFLSDIEKMAVEDPDHNWCVIFDGPLWGCTYQRQGEGLWLMIEKNRGWA